jgi:hypothetical protein
MFKDMELSKDIMAAFDQVRCGNQTHELVESFILAYAWS